MTALLCIRHAQSTLNAEGRWQGQADPPLSEAGVAQARALAERLAHDATLASAPGAVALFASDLRRAAQTARLLGARLGVEPVLHAGLRELDVGAWSGLRHAEIAARWPEELARFRAGDCDLAPGGGESRRQLAKRVGAALCELREAAGDRPLAMVTHLGVLRILSPGIELGNAEHVVLERGIAPWPAPGGAHAAPAEGAL